MALTVGAAGAAAVAAPPRKAGVPLRLPLPRMMRDTGGGTQLLTVTAPTLASTTATLVQWEKTGSAWKQVGSLPARLGAKGLVEGTARKQNTDTTPTGLFGLPFAFGNAAAPAGTTLAYRPVTGTSWWCEDAASTAYNRWTSPLPKDCRASESERLADYPTQYAHAVVIDFNYAKPVKGRGAGIFLHVNGSGATAGCVSVPAAAMNRILAWLKPGAAPHIAIGTAGGGTAVSRY
ncbi:MULTISPECIES: L,D-transpeptidase family protein [unclassified Streptomyces]|uniref:L,D-transpeptidase family protein n=1 Tax=unclassified Streptomyces TaxID=2593676 RepID=UPI000B85758E|nr:MULTISPECIES: L,D-transpeptidase family protein [unclassified Streptomyces]MYS24063.1 L,D-transpeptidase family protein [Streptomyces sp. SID4948]